MKGFEHKELDRTGEKGYKAAFSAVRTAPSGAQLSSPRSRYSYGLKRAGTAKKFTSAHKLVY
jgi:hypothetical protein